jgi:sterol desaturase/sphingolipid hydroxylase (fatty acid hydroxylase superfamily)
MDWLFSLPGLIRALIEIAVASVWFFLLAWLVKGRERAIADGKAAAGQTRINLFLWTFDEISIGPLLFLATSAIIDLIHSAGFFLPTAPLWAWCGPVGTVIVAVIGGDFIGYWRHRLQHSRWLWPSHAVHHSDTHLTWLSLTRMHPVDRIVTASDAMLLGMLGLPLWAIAVNVLIRHYWGYVLHADVPWTLGKAERLINSPAMHRWHHARDVEGHGSNFATVFSVWDRLFGTLHNPGPCTAPLGVHEDMGEGVVGQYAHPFTVWFGRKTPSAPVAAAQLIAAE